jgi:hypothetical protein
MVNSDVFHAMFSHENTKEAREGRIVIEDSVATAVRQMLIYMYTGELPKEYAIETDASPLMYTANKYEIKSLVHLIEQELVNRFVSNLVKTCGPRFAAPAHGHFLRYLESEGSLDCEISNHLIVLLISYRMVYDRLQKLKNQLTYKLDYSHKTLIKLNCMIFWQ